MITTVRTTALLGFPEYAASQGLDPQAMLAEAGLPGDALAHPDNLLAYPKFNALLELGAKRSGNPLFGLQFGLHQGTQILGNLLYVIQHAKTVGEALEALKRYFHIHNSGAEVRLEQQAGNAILCYEVTDGNVASVRQDVELAIAIGAQLMQNLLGRRWRPSALLLRHPPAAESSAYRRLLGSTPRFDSPYNAWVFDAALLDAQLSAADERLQQLVQQRMDDLAQISLPELPSYVQRLLRDMLPNGKVTIEQVAEYMMISPRTLQRYLMEENTGFQELLDKTRQSMSTRYICDSSISLTQLAGLLGYADLSAFSRAFTRWNGVSPRSWKQRYLQEQAQKPAAASAGTPPQAP